MVRSNYHGPLAQAEGRLRLTHLPPCPGPLPPHPHPEYPAEFPTSALSGVFLLIIALRPPARPAGISGKLSPFGLSLTRRPRATGEGDGDAADGVNNNNNNNSLSSLVKQCEIERPIWVYGARFYSRGDGVADAAQLRWKV